MDGKARVKGWRQRKRRGGKRGKEENAAQGDTAKEEGDETGEASSGCEDEVCLAQARLSAAENAMKIDLQLQEMYADLQQSELEMEAVRNAVSHSIFQKQQQQQEKPPAQRVDTITPHDFNSAETLKHCETGLDAVAAESGVVGATDFSAFCTHVFNLRRAGRVSSREVGAVVSYVLDANGMLWVLRHKLQTVASVAVGDAAILGPCMALLGDLQQLLRDVAALASALAASRHFDTAATAVNNAVRALLAEAVAAVRGRGDRSRVEAGVGELLACVERLWSVGGEGHPEADAYEVAAHNVVGDVEKACAVVWNPYMPSMSAGLAAYVRAARVEQRLSYGDVADVVSCFRYQDEQGVEIPPVTPGAPHDGLLLCLAARRHLQELHPSYHVAWRSVNATGPITDFATSAPQDADPSSLFTSPACR